MAINEIQQAIKPLYLTKDIRKFRLYDEITDLISVYIYKKHYSYDAQHLQLLEIEIKTLFNKL